MKTIYSFSILTLSRCTDHKHDFAVYFCAVLRASQICASVAEFGCDLCAFRRLSVHVSVGGYFANRRKRFLIW